MIFCDYPIIGSEKELPVYLINMGLQQCQDHVIRRNGYPCPQILFCTKGSGTLLYENKKCLIPPNTVLYLPADFPHEYYPDEDVWNIHWIVPAGDALPLLLGNLDMKEPGIFHLTETTRLEYLFRSMHDALHSDNLLGNYRASGLLYSFLVEFNLCISHRVSGNTYHPALIKAIDYINNHYPEDGIAKRLDMKSRLREEFSENQAFKVNEIGDKLFGNHQGKKQEFDEKIERYDMQYDTFTVAKENTVKRLEYQMLETDTGIEIKIPMEEYNMKDNVEIIEESGGGSTIIIKNIESVKIK